MKSQDEWTEEDSIRTVHQWTDVLIETAGTEETCLMLWAVSDVLSRNPGRTRL